MPCVSVLEYRALLPCAAPSLVTADLRGLAGAEARFRSFRRVETAPPRCAVASVCCGTEEPRGAARPGSSAQRVLNTSEWTHTALRCKAKEKHAELKRNEVESSTHQVDSTPAEGAREAVPEVQLVYAEEVRADGPTGQADAPEPLALDTIAEASLKPKASKEVDATPPAGAEEESFFDFLEENDVRANHTQLEIEETFLPVGWSAFRSEA